MNRFIGGVEISDFNKREKGINRIKTFNDFCHKEKRDNKK